jgi:2-polyprenyl-3-methyl-5-hydroxy-6-metoxy-1,4-benzoquinol methylase
MFTAKHATEQLRLLVAIASYGQKNLHLVKEIIRQYRGMDLKVDVVVLSEAPKELGPGVEVRVGLPSSNPWSLPFGHKRLFAERVEQYDLFAYSEDDMGVTSANIQAYLRATAQLQADEIAGFLRYEVDGSGAVSLPDMQGSGHWKADSVKRRGEYTVAEFTNEHAAFYLLTREQLRWAIASGGFLREPYEAQYDMLCTAATDPYTSCGFRKVICISALRDFLIHHRSNVYVGRFGLPLAAVEEQMQTLMAICDGAHPASRLCGLETRFVRGRWSKDFYEPANQAVLSSIPDRSKIVLSIGCGQGKAESALRARGASITVVPLDSVMGVMAASRGLEVVYGTWEEAMGKLAGRKFEAVLVAHLLHLLPRPGEALEQCCRLVAEGGTLVASGPNFDRLPTLLKRILGRNGYALLRSFEQSGIAVCGPAGLAKHIERAGLRTVSVRWFDQESAGRLQPLARRQPGRWTSGDWILQARL